ncbi:MAG: formylmethanofuran dehydrogenase [Rhodospirillales bacterium]|jgi:formylmethanofuran dehydrogenase subunit B|nr:formylmethanofuran dehydrogenase [Rhodospirillales bacterium]
MEARLEEAVCPFCSLACDDLHLKRTERGGVALVGPECPLARTGYIEAGTDEDLPPRIDGQAVAESAAIERAAALIASSAAPLVAGLAAEVDGVRAALALADACGAALDHLRAEGLMRLLLPLIERGAVQTTLSELRNRADLVLVLGPDPRRIAPRLIERALPPTGLFVQEAAPRRILFIGGVPETELAPHLSVQVIPAPTHRLAELAGALARLIAGKALPRPEIAGVPAARLAELAQQMRDARYGVALFAPALLEGAEPELAVAAILHLIQELNRTTRWSALPVAGGDGLIGASQAMLWQSGVPLRSRFTPEGPRFAPHRLAADRLLREREADLLIWISAFRPAPPPEASVPMIALAHPETRFARPPEVFLPVGVPGVDHGGAAFRMDGVVALPLAPARASTRKSAAGLLAAIHRALPMVAR